MRFPPISKPRPKLLDKREAKAKVCAEDRAENAKVKARSGGWCEVSGYHFGDGPIHVAPNGFHWRCRRRGAHIHHLISGMGRRNVGKSIKAEHKLHVCELHHEEIHGHVLKPTSEETRYDAATVRYERVK